MPPKYVADINFENLQPHQILVLTLEAAKKLSWTIREITESGFSAHTKMSLRSYGEGIVLKVEEGHVRVQSSSNGGVIIDLGRNKKNIDQLAAAINEIKDGLSPGILDQKFHELKPSLSAIAQTVSNPKAVLKGGLFALFKPVKGYFITPILIDLNILMFLLMIISGVSLLSPTTESLIKWGANFRPITLEGEWWRLITNCFLHIGIIHLLFNMYALLYVGLLLEPYMGKTKFLVAYLLTGIAGSVTSIGWHPFTVSAGASGAIFGMYGVFLALLTTNLIEKSSRKALLFSIGIFVFYNLANGVKGGIDNAAHVGGLLSGIIIGYAYLPSIKKPAARSRGFIVTIFLIFLVLGCSAIIYHSIPNDIGEYDQKMDAFEKNEKQALSIYRYLANNPKDYSKDSVLHEISDHGIALWNKNLSLLDGMTKLNLPDTLKNRDQKLIDYYHLRIQVYQLLYTEIKKDSLNFSDSVAFYNQQILSIIQELKAGK